jgi:16S rRNA (guanine966-N2)-methyltransferase
MDSRLQVISGKYRGRKLHLPPNSRPTQNRARIAVFNMLCDLRPRVIWDAFAGSGAFGIEWISRTNSAVIFTDTDADAIKTIKKNMANLSDAKAKIIQRDALDAAPQIAEKADLIFIDPPYAAPELGEKLIRKIAPAIKPDTIIVWEMEKNFTHSPLPNNLRIIRDKTYGRARFLIITADQY